VSDEHILEKAAKEIATWLDEMPKKVAEEIMQGGRSPFAADVPEQEKLAYYNDRFFNPDGTPNVVGRQEEYDRIGPQQFNQVLLAVTKYRMSGTPGRQVLRGGRVARRGA